MTGVQTCALPISIKRLYGLDSLTYQNSALDEKTKEMLGLVSSLVLRCDDCVKYHLEKCFELKVNKEELFDIFAVGSVVGGTITIPHIRKAVEFWEELEFEFNDNINHTDKL